MAFDLAVFESNSGGDTQLIGKDLAIYSGWENFPYLGLFGGNVQASTKGTRLENEQAFDYWGNRLFMANDESIQFNSLTERLLMNTALNSSGRIKIEEAVKSDLKFMAPFSNITTNVQIISDDRVSIEIRVQEPNNLQAKEFVFIWDSTKAELVTTPSYKNKYGDFDMNDFNNDFF